MRRSLLLLVLLGCGGRDPLYGVSDSPDATGGAGATTGSGGTIGGSPGTGGAVGTPGSGGTPASGGAPGTGGGPVTMPPPPDAAVPPPPIRGDAGVSDAARDTAPPSGGMCAFPGCLAKLFFDCTPSGRCVQQRFMGGNNIGNNVCYGNGVKLSSSLSGGRNPAAAIKVFKADGTLCYTVEPEQRGGGVTGLTYRDSSGQVVASGTLDRNTLAVACAGTTTPQSLAVSCQPGLQGSTNNCTNGMCM